MGKARRRKIERRAAKEAENRRSVDASNIAIWATAGLVLIAVILMFLFAGSGKAPTPRSSGSPTTGPVPPAVMEEITKVPATALDKAGAGGGSPPTVMLPERLPSGTPALVSDGKPRIVYIGAEFCPYCAALRWPLVQALSRFGRFTGLGASESEPAPERYPNTQTFTFYGSTYKSPYIAFSPVETGTTGGQPLQQVPQDLEKLFQAYGKQSSIPFLDLGGRYAQTGTSFDPELLQGMSLAQIASSLADTSSATGQAVDGSANVLTAAVCELTAGRPEDVCTAPGVRAGAQRLAAGSAPVFSPSP